MQTSVFLTGFSLAAALIMAIGAQNAFVLRQGLRSEHVVFVVVFCVLADALLIFAGVSGMARVLGNAPGLTFALTLGGIAFLAWYGMKALARVRASSALTVAEGNGRSSLRSVAAQVAGFTFLNPHVYLDTVLLVGSIGARQPDGLRYWFIGGAAAASGAWFTALGFGARLLRPVFRRAGAWKVLDAVVGLTMLALAGGLLLRLGT